MNVVERMRALLIIIFDDFSKEKLENARIHLIKNNNEIPNCNPKLFKIKIMIK